MPSSPITALIDQLPMELRAIQSDPAALWDVFSALPDPRNPRGVRHQFTGVLVIALCAVLAGARSFDAIAEWAADGAATVLAALGIGVPHSATIRRVLCRTDADAFDQAIGTWVTAQTGPKVIALDGKEVRGAKHGNGTRVHLMSALDHESRTVLGQVDVAQKTNEIPMFSTLLDTIKDLEEVIVTADAMHAQRAHATYLHGRGAHYVLTVKGNQKSLQRQLRSLPWGQVPTGDTAHFRRPRTHRHPQDQGSECPGRIGVPTRRTGHRSHPMQPQTGRKETDHRNRVRDDRPTGRSSVPGPN